MGHRLYRALQMRNELNSITSVMEDKDAIDVVHLFMPWQNNKLYVTGERIRYEDILYKVLQEHTSQEDWTPDISPSLFAKVLIPDEDVVPAWEQPNSTNPYMTGDKVTHNDRTWVSNVDNNVWEPGVYGWSEV